MAAVPDLVDHFRLETQFHSDQTVHVVAGSNTGYERRKVRVEKRWIKGKRIGRGTFGDVWLETGSDGDKRAVKAIEKQITFRYQIDYMKELLAMAKLSKHAELFVHFHGWYENDDTVFLAMEYCGQGDLSTCVTPETPCLESDAKIITSQLLEGLNVMHGYGFAHRDLKPQNIFVVQRQPEWWVKIGDFGIAKRVQNEDTELRTEVGTRNFKAPEVLGLSVDTESAFEYTNAVDIWSLGCVVHWLLTQKVPFDLNSLYAYIEQGARFPERALHINSVGDAGVEFIESLMAGKPSQRLTAKSALESEWIRAVERPPPSPIAGPDICSVSTNLNSSALEPLSALDLPHPVDQNGGEHIADPGTSKIDSTQSTVATNSSDAPISMLSSISLDSPVQGTAQVLKSTGGPGLSADAVGEGTAEKQVSASTASWGLYEIPAYHAYAEAARKAGDGRSPLHLAAFAGDDQAVEQLIANGAEVDAEDDVEETALHRACKNGKTWVAEILLRSGGNVNARGQDGETPLWLAAWQGHVEVAITLVSNGADLELRTDRDANGARYTPLIIAARNERKEVVRLLLRKGANIGAKDTYGNTALHHAVQRKDKEMVMLLVDSDADVGITNDLGQTALHLATINIPALLAYLKRRGADIESRDVDKYTPLHLAAGSGSPQGTEYLIMSGADMTARTSLGDTPFLLAAKGGLQRMMDLLLNHQADVEETNYAGRTALLEAAALNDTSIIRFLIEKGANIHARDRRGATALIIASGHYDDGTVQLFLEKGLDLEATSKDGTTALLEAAERGSLMALRVLVDQGAEIEAKDSRGNTSLLRAASAGWEHIAEALIEAGADIDAKNLKDETSVQVAERSGRSLVTNLLKREIGKRKIAALSQPRG